MAATGERAAGAAFFCMSSDVYFIGAVGMINSLRRAGHREPIFLLDLGLTPRQRELLAAEVTIVGGADDSPPWLLKTIAPLEHPAETMVHIDADMIVTRPLGDLIEGAAGGKLLAFRTSYDRHFPEWGPLLGLGELRRQPYVCSGLFATDGELGEQVLRLMDERREAVAEIGFGKDERARRGVFFALDQDLLNAILSSRIEAERSVALDYRLAPAPPYDGLRLVDLESSRCAYPDGTEPYVVHQHGRKPWLDRLRSSVYSRLLTRHLTGSGLAIEVPLEMIPRRLRPGLAGGLLRAPSHLRDRIGPRRDPPH